MFILGCVCPYRQSNHIIIDLLIIITTSYTIVLVYWVVFCEFTCVYKSFIYLCIHFSLLCVSSMCSEVSIEGTIMVSHERHNIYLDKQLIGLLFMPTKCVGYMWLVAVLPCEGHIVCFF